ncbi:hypothetical protein LX81_02358 [Palleronia aestuarii]|uniref:Secreted protein n=1 Tax=Palleronia aestuarii TaxID=568105 RepID=A0A2W7NR60_9RHOB|nr:hypothetical protein [Palleronia aestuarii]PZX15726.1 hypothetical protein LX81_02358 [Palleronia aestuarii]
MNLPFTLTAVILGCATPASADPAEIVDAVARPDASGWTISVTIRHADTGWEDFADGWRVELADGTILATRKIRHPHVVEQPFTRSEMGIAIPPDAGSVRIRARTSPEGWGGQTVELRIPDHS